MASFLRKTSRPKNPLQHSVSFFSYPDECTSLEYEKEIDSIPEKGCELIALIREKLEALAWSQDDLFRIHLALEEVVMNAIKHGNSLDASKKVSVDCNVVNDLFTVIVKDEGKGFIREEIPDPTEGENVLSR